MARSNENAQTGINKRASLSLSTRTSLASATVHPCRTPRRTFHSSPPLSGTESPSYFKSSCRYRIDTEHSSHMEANRTPCVKQEHETGPGGIDRGRTQYQVVGDLSSRTPHLRRHLHAILEQRTGLVVRRLASKKVAQQLYPHHAEQEE